MRIPSSQPRKRDLPNEKPEPPPKAPVPVLAGWEPKRPPPVLPVLVEPKAGVEEALDPNPPAEPTKRRKRQRDSGASVESSQASAPGLDA